ncbi:hypothetical protein BU23DRAFT_40099 [Bimuria novae-zelandiae CBS 107.79]|uniref:DUF1279 domain-containing protein n=1 Tax=Bimuria novae-zelandiae CBS 107.79 TaxID=1447943 RepID=A0A6A5UJD2_9PLEO|nr:hypothetical protein BU23DRAFT_40099 [Bimuria novae-zelandiae CBS 107.79]
MSAPAFRIWTEQLLLRGALSRSSAAGRPKTRIHTFSSLPRGAPRAAFHQNSLGLLRNERTTVAARFRCLRFKSDKPPHSPNPTPHLGSPPPAPSLSQRLKRLSKEYGWLAVGVYFGLSVLDFPFCFLAVRMLGTDRVGHYEHVVVEGIKSLIRIPFPDLFKGSDALEGPIAEEIREAAAREEALGHDGARVVGHDGGAEASLWTQLAIAYAVHKSLIFFRIPLTAAVLPKVAKTLRKWGWNVGRAKPT